LPRQDPFGHLRPVSVHARHEGSGRLTLGLHLSRPKRSPTRCPLPRPLLGRHLVAPISPDLGDRQHFVVIELKTGEFKPEYAGKMNFYLSAVDAQLRRDGDQPSIGLVLCKEKNKVVVEYALRDTRKPIGVSAYHLLEKLPSKLKGSLPTVEEFEAELGGKMKPRDG